MAEVDPFFARYGLQIHVDHDAILPLLDWGIRRKVSKLPHRIAGRVQTRIDKMRQKLLLTTLKIKIPYGLCTNCSFLAPWFEIGDDQLNDYYAFYLKEEYKQARSTFQPGFRELGKLMGSTEEARLRREQHETFIEP